MNRPSLIAVALLALIAPASAEDHAPAGRSAPRPAPDLSLSVTLTGHEIQLLMNAVRAEAAAQAASAAAAPVTAKIADALTPPADKAQGPAPVQ